MITKTFGNDVTIKYQVQTFFFKLSSSFKAYLCSLSKKKICVMSGVARA
jgi:hypothetical protein